MSIRIVLFSKHQVLSEGIAAVLRTHQDMQLVGISENFERTQALCEEMTPDVLVVSILSHSELDLAFMYRMSDPDHPQNMVVYSSESDRHSILEILDAGAKGFVSTTSSMDELMLAIRSAALNRTYLCQSAATEMMESIRQSRSGDITIRTPLGGREEQVLRLVADGYSSKEIARNLQIAPSTVEVHRRNIMRKVGLHKVADLTRYAIRNQMLSL